MGHIYDIHFSMLVLLHHNGNKYICDVHGARQLIVLYFHLLQEHLGCVYKLLIILADEL